MKLREGCIRCFNPAEHPGPHLGDHLIHPSYGGRASCPADESDDPDILEELAWVSLEAALEDAGWTLTGQTALADDVRDCLQTFSLAPAGLGLEYAGHLFQWERRTDEHLEAESSTCDVVCTITGPLVAEAPR